MHRYSPHPDVAYITLGKKEEKQRNNNNISSDKFDEEIQGNETE